jgi:hypothetical protein
MNNTTPEILQLAKGFEKDALNIFAKIAGERLESQQRFLDDYSALFKKLPSGKMEPAQKDELLNHHITYKNGLLKLLTQTQTDLPSGDFGLVFGKFVEKAQNLISQSDDPVFREEVVTAYRLKLKDGPVSGFKKLLHNIRLNGWKNSRKLANIFRKWVKKQPLELQATKQRKIPFSGMAEHFFILLFAEKCLEQFRATEHSNSRLMMQIWKHDAALDDYFQHLLYYNNTADEEFLFEKNQPLDLIATMQAELAATRQKLAGDIEANFAEANQEFEKAFAIADTLDGAVVKFSSNAIEKQWKNLAITFEKQQSGWRNTHAALLDDWALDVEISHHYYAVFSNFNQLKNRLNGFAATRVEPLIASVSDFISRGIADVKSSQRKPKELETSLLRLRTATKTALVDDMLTPAAGMMDAYFSDGMTDFDRDIGALIGQISNKRTFIKSQAYDTEARPADINSISPVELLGFEAWPGFRSSVQQIRKEGDLALEHVKVGLLSLSTICDFNLETALMKLEQKDTPTEDSMHIALEGFERAMAQLDSALRQFQATSGKAFTNLLLAIKQYNTDIQKLKNTENLFNLNLKIARIKTLEQSRKVRRKMLENIRHFIPLFIRYSKEVFTNLDANYRQLRLRLGIEVEKKSLSFELSEFIIESQRALQKLPFVYQRLYKLQPTDEERFFVNREYELTLLQQSYANWMKDRFITTAIIGEKGSGITSLINIFLKSLPVGTEVLSHTIDEKVYTTDRYMQLMRQITGMEEAGSQDELIENLNNLKVNRIIVLENLQHMFLKMVGGFDCMKMFFELISHTSKKVMWVCAFTPNSWNFLEKTISITNYFIDEIYLDKLSDVALREIIYKRNKLSGYRLEFIADNETLSNKTYQKLNEEQKQQFAEKQYFANLSRIANGNVSLAQLFWLRSTVKVDEQSIYIGNPGALDFSFVKTLDSNSLFALQALIIHDGLNIGDFAKVLNQPQSVSRNLLIPMLEKGLLIKPREKFNISPIIYRHVSAFLASRNFIH